MDYIHEWKSFPLQVDKSLEMIQLFRLLVNFIFPKRYEILDKCHRYKKYLRTLCWLLLLQITFNWPKENYFSVRLLIIESLIICSTTVTLLDSGQDWLKVPLSWNKPQAASKSDNAFLEFLSSFFSFVYCQSTIWQQSAFELGEVSLDIMTDYQSSFVDDLREKGQNEKQRSTNHYTEN
jgi:hypothetical protein